LAVILETKINQQVLSLIKFDMKKRGLLAVMLIYVSISYGQKMNIEVNSKAKAYAIDSIEINAPSEKVYSLIAYINNWPNWLEGVTEVNLKGDIQEGTEFTWKAKGYKMKSRIHTIKNNLAIGWTGKMWWIKAVHNWRFKSDLNGKTKVIVQENFAGFCSSFMRNSLT
jgi:uncharacterized membrane protein